MPPARAPGTERPAWTRFAVAGAAAGCAVAFSNPLEVVKTKLQLQGELAAGRGPRMGFAEMMRRIARTEGLRGLQRGLPPAMAFQFVMNGTRLGSYEVLRGDDAAQAGFLRTVLAGMTAGGVGAFVSSPLSLVKVRLQTQSASPELAVGHQHNIKSWPAALVDIYRRGGVRGLWHGVDGAVPRVMIGSAVQLSTYDRTKTLLGARTGLSGAPLHFAASLAAGLLVTTAMNPADVISSRLYNDPVDPATGRGTLYRGPVDCLRKTVAAEGWAALYKGWLAHYVRLGPHTILCFVFWEAGKGLLDL